MGWLEQLLRQSYDENLTKVEDEASRPLKPWILTGLFFLVAGVLLSSWILLAAALLWFVILGGAWIWAKWSLVGLRYTREFSETRAFLGETVTMTLKVQNRKLLPLNAVEIVDVFPLNLPGSGVDVTTNPLTNQGELSSFWMLGAFQTLKRSFAIKCTTRGYHIFGPASLTTGDGLGLFSRKGVVQSEQRLIIYPHVYSAAELGLPAKNPFGERPSDQRLFEDPLRNAGIREWVPGDGLRRVHWKATARHQKLLSRIYEPSEEPQIQIVLNTATLERYWEGCVPELLERLLSVAAGLATYCIDRRMPVGLIANSYLPGSDQYIRLLPGRSNDQLMHLLELLAVVQPFGSRPIERLLLKETTSLPWGATLLVVTAVVGEDLVDAVKKLVRSGRKVVLFSLEASPPEPLLDVTTYHLPHLVDDLIAPVVVRR